MKGGGEVLPGDVAFALERPLDLLDSWMHVLSYLLVGVGVCSRRAIVH